MSNLIRIMAELTKQTPEQVCDEFIDMTIVQFKGKMTDLLTELISPMRDIYVRVRSDQSYLNHIFTTNAHKANAQAERTLARVHAALGFAPLQLQTVHDVYSESLNPKSS